jgi:hypothetical protein
MLNLARDWSQLGVTPDRWIYFRQYGKIVSGWTKRSACHRFMKLKYVAVQRLFNESMGKLSPERVNDQFQFGTMAFYVCCAVHRNKIIQYKPNKCKFPKLKVKFLIFMSSIWFETEGSSSRGQLYIQLWYGTSYMRQNKQCLRTERTFLPTRLLILMQVKHSWRWTLGFEICRRCQKIKNWNINLENLHFVSLCRISMRWYY